ncbi:Glyoxalase/Bleomycin resistance protein/Dihydroxybiphenyl dioxygenase [Patellaria atrata CBS 101060]|uniref:Glyoxalase/Bleomycin resistance protein/Dihydroxybiphenyl dioxygenase n=1 Tax=Patellaria atrata CBS 101060 TaxID=1346257 RepID=A0A9P4S806_9PEZI|nr:Glyoxalase/Bleomycin resistance protein/Dihydroxybiphenyl dioxygenase [Patellaria atrata CBS 101060]
MSPAATEPPKISLKRIAHINYTHADHEAAHKFLLDFGFTVAEEKEDRTYYKGYGKEPFVYCSLKGSESKFSGAGFVVDSLEDLERASETLPGASKIEDLDAPGGGKRVTFYEPIDNCPWHLIYGQSEKGVDDSLPELDYNYPTHKNRPVNHTQRFKHGPAPIHKLGHFGLCTTNYKKAYEFYTKHFNLKSTDLVYDGDTNEDITTFMHLDRGKEQVDHHCFFFFEGPKFHVHHSSYEVHDFDIQGLGHQWLREKGYDLVWGIGRHVLGSQIFDYWWDPSKFMMEHYVDGDLVDDTTPTSRTKAGPGNLHIWGPELPPTFLM